MGDQEKNFVIYDENGDPVDVTVKNIELATEEYLDNHKKLIKKGEVKCLVKMKFPVSYLQYDVMFTKLQIMAIDYKINNGTRSSYLQRMCYLERKEKKV